MKHVVPFINFINENNDIKTCPAPTQSVALNTANRDRAIRSDYINYGPLNVEEPGDYWQKIAK